MEPHSSKPPKYILKTLGCKANFYDTQLIESALLKEGWKPKRSADDSSDVQICVVNSCTVTDEADKQSIKLAKKLKKDFPNSKIIFTGCSAEVDPLGASAQTGIQYVVGNQNKDQLVHWVLKLGQESAVQKSAGVVLGSVSDYGELRSRHPMDREWGEPESLFRLPEFENQEDVFNLRTRSFIKIQEGCDSFCTYCIIPYGRGPSRSLSIEKVTEQVNQLVQNGVQEVVLTGTNIGDYTNGTNTSERIEDLCEAILLKTSLKRLRVSSLDPIEISDRLLDLVRGELRFCPHFHVSLQSPVSKILKLMKRKYTGVEVIRCLENISKLKTPRSGNVFVGMDLITGFPGETSQDFEETFSILQNLYWTRLHVFPFSERKKTPAARLPGSVTPMERSRRADRLRALSFDRFHQMNQSVLEDCIQNKRAINEVLLEGAMKGPDGKKWHSGYSPNYVRCLVPAQNLEMGSTQRNQIVSFVPHTLLADRAAGDVALMGEIKK